MDITINKMTADDVPAVADIEKACFASPWTYEGILEEVDNPSSFFLVARSDRVAGYIGVQEIAGEAYITNIAVLPAYRGQGIGGKLLRAAAEGAKKRGCAFITLEVRESNKAAIRLYEKNGFSVAGMRKNFYSSPAENAVLYTLFFNSSERKDTDGID